MKLETWLGTRPEASLQEGRGSALRDADEVKCRSPLTARRPAAALSTRQSTADRKPHRTAVRCKQRVSKLQTSCSNKRTCGIGIWTSVELTAAELMSCARNCPKKGKKFDTGFLENAKALRPSSCVEMSRGFGRPADEPAVCTRSDQMRSTRKAQQYRRLFANENGRIGNAPLQEKVEAKSKPGQNVRYPDRASKPELYRGILLVVARAVKRAQAEGCSAGCDEAQKQNGCLPCSHCA